MEYSSLFKNKKVLCKSAPYIYNINDIEEIISEINTLIEKNEIEQYYRTIFYDKRRKIFK